MAEYANAPKSKLPMRAVWRAVGLVVIWSMASLSYAIDIHSNGAAEERLFGSWGLHCLNRTPKICILSQVVATDALGRQVVLGATVDVDLTSRRQKLNFRMSHDALASAGLGLKIDKGAEYRLPMSGCDRQTCLASGWLEGGLRTALESGTVAQVAYLLQDRKQVLVPLSLRGFKAGVRALIRSTPRAD